MKNPGRKLAAVARVDQMAEQQGPCDAADRSADGVEEGDCERPRLHREDLADGQVGRAGAGRGEEERRAHERDERPLRQRRPRAAAARVSPRSPPTRGSRATP